MPQLNRFRDSLRAFWADPAQRRVLMWVLLVVSAAIVAYGAVQGVRAHVDYQDRTNKVEAAEQQAVALEESLGLVGAAEGEEPTEISDSDAMLIFALRRQVREAETAQVQAFNRRSEAIRVIGIGIIGLALAYLVAPTGQKRPAPEEIPPVSSEEG